MLLSQGFIKSFHLSRTLELAMLCKFDSPAVWKTFHDQLLYNCEYESLRDIIEVLEQVKDQPQFQNDNFWQRMMEKIVKMRMSLTVRDILEIEQLYSEQANLSKVKRREMVQYIQSHSKPFIVEEVDSLAFKDLLTLVQMFQNDIEFKRFLSHHLKEKMMLTANLPQRDLMTALIETLDVEEIRGEITRYALNSEIFYAFPIQYLISLLKKLSLIQSL